MGLCGGVASGKSTVARLLARQGAHTLDADAAARDSLEETEVKQAVVEKFGESVLQTDGSIDRSQVAARVFGPGGAADRGWLEGLIHPRVRARLRRELDAVAASEDAPWCCVLDVPLLVEGPLVEWCDRIVFIESSTAARQRRAVEDRGWPPDERARREGAQTTLSGKRSRAHHVIKNDGTLDDLSQVVDDLVTRLRSAAVSRPLPHSGPTPPDGHPLRGGS